MKKLLSLIIFVLPMVSLANEHAEHVIEIPSKTIFWQVFNLTIMFAGIIYFTKNQIKAAFLARRESYIEASKKSANAKKEAEKSYLEVKHKLEQLQSAQDESLARATAEAADMRNSLIAEANALAKRISDEAEQAIKIEVARAQAQLKEQLIKDSVSAARLVLVKDVATADQTKLQTEFVNHI